MWNLKNKINNKQNKNKIIDTENRLVDTRGTSAWGYSEMGRGDQLYGDGW